MATQFKLRDDQMEDLVKITRDKKLLLLSEPGTGKTPTVIVNMYRRWSVNKIKTVWVMPKSLMKKNVREVLRFSNFKPEDVVVVDGSPAKVKKQLESDAKIFIMGPARFRISFGSLPDPRTTAIDVDEFHLCFAGGNSQATQCYLRYSAKSPEGIPMTGTLINGRLDTAWPAIHAIDPRYYPLGLAQFMARHAVCDDYGKPMFWKDHARIGQIVIKHGIRRLFKDIFGDQEVLTHVEVCELSPAQAKLYREFEAKAMVELDNFMIEGTTPGVATIRARQILDHPRDFPDLMNPGKFIDIVKGELTGKEESLKIHVEDHIRQGTPFVVFSSLVPQQQQLHKIITDMGVSCGLMDSSKSGTQRGRIDEDFVAGRLQAIVSSPPIASTGFNWQFWGPERIEVPHCIFASMPYLDGDYVQAYARFIRENRETPLRISLLTYSSAIEDRIFNILEKKSKDANAVDPTRTVLDFSY